MKSCFTHLYVLQVPEHSAYVTHIAVSIKIDYITLNYSESVTGPKI